MKKETIHFILSEIAKQMQIADLEGQLYLLERKQKLLNKLEKMGKFKGTKGEWFVSGGTEIVSMPLQVKISNNISGANYAEAEANARLIAAAPDLLEACKEALRHHQGGHSEIGHMLRDVITKAEGDA